MVEVTSAEIEHNDAYKEKKLVPGVYPKAFLDSLRSKRQEAEPSMDNLPLRRILTVGERKSLEEQKKIFGYGAAAGQNFVPGSMGIGAVDVSQFMPIKRHQLNEQQKEVIKILEEGSPEPVAAKDRDRYDKLCEEMKEKFTDPEYFQTRDECRVTDIGKPEFFSALDKADKWQKPQAKLNGYSPEQLCNAWRNLRRRLHPDDPQADNVDRLRRSK